MQSRATGITDHILPLGDLLFVFLFRYRREDDVSHPYGFTYRRTKSKGYLPQFPHPDHKPGHLVAWMASNCKAPNGRERYVQFLKKFLHVKIFGDCGEKCEKGKQGEFS